MDVYGSGVDVTVEIDLIDRSGTVITPVTADYKVYDETGALLGSSSLTVVGSESSLSVTVAAADNIITDPNGARTVLLNVQSVSGTHQLTATYVIQLFGFLSVPVQSGMTETEAAILNVDMPSIIGYDNATEEDRRAALLEAWSRLSRMAYKPWREYDKTSASSAYETHPTIVDGDFRLNELDAGGWAVLPAPFKAALKRSQMIEADVILEGDPTWDRRVDGLMSKTVGESSEMFRPGKPVITAVSMKAMRELSGFLSFSVKIGRA